MVKMLSKFICNPLGSIKIAFKKLVVDPLRYSTKNDYDASRYWKERLVKYGHSFKGVGVESLSEEENRQMYAEAGHIFRQTIEKQNIDLAQCRILEIGVGNGFYTGLLRDMGAIHYTGLDITDALFPQHRNNFPEFEFIHKDITTGPIDKKFDLIIMIDVIEHIIQKPKLDAAMKNISAALSMKGVFLLAPVMEKGKKHLFHVRFWSIDDITPNFPEFHFDEPLPFRDSFLLTIKKP